MVEEKLRPLLVAVLSAGVVKVRLRRLHGAGQMLPRLVEFSAHGFTVPESRERRSRSRAAPARSTALQFSASPGCSSAV